MKGKQGNIILLKIKQQAPFLLLPSFAAALIFLKFIPFPPWLVEYPSSSSLSFSLSRPSLSPVVIVQGATSSPTPSVPSFLRSFMALHLLFPSIFCPPPICRLIFNFMASHIFNLAAPPQPPNQPPPLPPPCSVSLSSTPSFLPSLPPLRCRTKWRLMKGGRCVCHPDGRMRPAQSPEIYSEKQSGGSDALLGGTTD